MKPSEFTLDNVDSWYYNWQTDITVLLHQASLNNGGSYIDSPKWLKNKKATINPDDKYFQYTVPVALNQEQIKKTLTRI